MSLRIRELEKSGLEGKSDLAVKFKDKWIYFEVTKKVLILLVPRTGN